MRNDIHSPSNFDPAQYCYVGSFDNWPEPGAFMGGREGDYDTPFGQVHALNFNHAFYTAGRALLNRDGAKIHFANGNSQCDHCGVRIRYVVIFRHVSGEVIATGETCAEERFGCDSRRAYDIKRLREAAANERERARAMGAAETFIQDAAPELAEWLLSPAAKDVHSIFEDIARKLIRYGSISPRQLDLCRKLLREHLERQQNNGMTLAEKARIDERATAADCPTGRTVVTGKVLKIKSHDGFYGTTLKMTVKDDSGFIVWVTVPSSASPETGDRIRFTATLTPSDDDPKFGFGKRPSNVSVTPAKPASLSSAEIAEQATAELHAEFPVITAENFEQADKFREERVQALKNGEAPILRDQWGNVLDAQGRKTESHVNVTGAAKIQF